LKTRLQLDRAGHVTDIDFTPELEPVALSQLRAEAEHWLFLPAVHQGRTEAATVEIPPSPPQ